MLLSQEKANEFLRCPKTGNKLNISSSSILVVDDEDGIEYPLIGDTPILVDFSDSILDEKLLRKTKVNSFVKRRKYTGLLGFLKKLVSPDKNVTANNIDKIMSLLKSDKKLDDDIMVLVIGGGSIGQGMMPLYDAPDLLLMAFDIYKSDNIQFVADAHKLPVPENSFDCVIIQAVLEHVLMPQKVVDEITRVLKMNGIVYSETPFLQHVHEGAYDFTRYTDSGHRYLYRDYDEIAAGASAGAGTQMLWSIDYFFRSLFRSRTAGKVIKLFFFWVQYLDKIMPEKYSIDAASGVYFLGKKVDKKFKPRDIVEYYKGAM